MASFQTCSAAKTRALKPPSKWWGIFCSLAWVCVGHRSQQMVRCENVNVWKCQCVFVYNKKKYTWLIKVKVDIYVIFLSRSSKVPTRVGNFTHSIHPSATEPLSATWRPFVLSFLHSSGAQPKHSFSSDTTLREHESEGNPKWTDWAEESIHSFRNLMSCVLVLYVVLI